MNRSKYLADMENSFNLLKKLKVLKESTFHYKQPEDRKFSDEFYENIHIDCNITKYRSILKNYDYDFILKDNSIFAFNVLFENNKISKFSMCFYQNPNSFPTIEDYDKYKDSFDFFEQKCDEANLTSSWTTIRYDYSEKEHEYKEFIHYPAHLHIGNNNDVRIPFDKLITPISFVNFVIMQVYPSIWMSHFHNDNSLLELRHSGENIVFDFLSPNDDKIYKIK